MRQNKGVNSAASGGQFKEPNTTTIDKVLYTGKTHTSRGQSGGRRAGHQLRLLLHARACRRGTKQPFINIVRQFIQKVVIGKTTGHQPASLEVYGRIASILAAMKATTIMEKRFEALKRHDYLEKMRAGELETEAPKKKLLDAYAEELSMKRLEWANIQVSLVAGAWT